MNSLKDYLFEETAFWRFFYWFNVTIFMEFLVLSKENYVKKNLHVFVIWGGWFIVSGSLVFLISRNDVDISGGLASLALVFFIISEIIVIFKKNKDFQNQVKERSRLSMDLSNILYKMLKERHVTLNEQFIKFVQGDSSFDVDELLGFQSKENKVFNEAKQDLENKLECIDNLKSQDKQNSLIHIWIVFGVLVSTSIWGWGSMLAGIINGQ
jgi:hypothetical protein